MIAVLVWRRESDVATGCVIVRQKLKSYRYPGYRRLIQGNLDEDAARRKCQLPGTGYGAVIVVEIDGNAVLTFGFKIRQGTLFTVTGRDFRAFTFRKRLCIQRHDIIFHINIERLGASHAAVGCYQIDAFGLAQVRLSSTTAGETGDTAHNDALAGLVTGVL